MRPSTRPAPSVTFRPALRAGAIAAAVAAASAGGVAFAAEQGERVEGGGGSTGSIGVGIEKFFAIRISGLEDVDFGEHAVANTDFETDESFCVYSSTGAFDLTMTSTNAGGGTPGAPGGLLGDLVGGTPDAMRMAGPEAGDVLAYTVTLADDATPLVSGEPRTNLVGDRFREDCGGADNVDFTLAISADAFNAAAPGAYSDVLTMFVEPR